MAVLDRQGYFDALQQMVGTDTSEQALAFLDNMTDTFNAMEQQAQGNGTDWEQKYHQLDDSWKKKYKARFFSGNGNSNIPYSDPDNDEPDPNKTRIEDLFKPANKR